DRSRPAPELLARLAIDVAHDLWLWRVELHASDDEVGDDAAQSAPRGQATGSRPGSHAVQQRRPASRRLELIVDRGNRRANARGHDLARGGQSRPAAAVVPARLPALHRLRSAGARRLHAARSLPDRAVAGQGARSRLATVDLEA